MKAIRLEAIGPPENLQLVDLPTPTVGPDDVLIKVELAGIIYADTEQRRGGYYLETKLPHYPGREVAGTIAAVGSNVDQWEVGQRVAALVLTGACYAEYVLAPTKPYQFPSGATAPSADILALPERVSFAQSLVYVINFRIAHMLFYDYAKAPEKRTIVLHGAAGGFGTVLTQIASVSHNTVIALCRTAEEQAYCRDNGADYCINVDNSDYVDVVLGLTNGQGADFSFNGVAGETLARDPLALRPFGEMIVYGYVGGKLPMDLFSFNKCISIKTFSADDFFADGGMQRATEAMFAWFQSRTLLTVTRVFPLAEAAAAHRWIEEGKSLGKVALQP